MSKILSIGTSGGGNGTLPDPVTETHGGTNQSTYATGDTLYASAANTLSKLAIGTPGYVTMASASGVPVWQFIADPSVMYLYFEDFLVSGINTTTGGGNVFGQFMGRAASSGTNSVVSLTTSVSSNTNPGVMGMDCGTTTTGSAWFEDSQNSGKGIYIGGGAHTYEALVKLSAVSDGTDTFQFRCGIDARGSGATSTDGIYFSYTHSANSGNLIAYASKASSSTTINSSTPLSTSWVKIGFVINAAATSVEYFINGASIGTINTNIPLTSTALTKMCIITKSAGSTARIAYVDYIKHMIFMATAR